MPKVGKLEKIGVLGLAGMFSGCVTNSFNDYNDNKYSKSSMPYRDTILRDAHKTLIDDLNNKDFVRIKKTTYKIYWSEKNDK